MKKVLFAAFGITILAGATLFAAEMDHSQMHEMMMRGGGPKEDTRIELKMPEPMKVMHKGIMRRHLDTLSEITEALAANDLNKAATIAKDNLGWSNAQEKMCAMFGTGDKNFLALGKAMHIKADDLANDAKAGNRDKAFADLAQLIKNCNACHEKFKH